MIDINPELLSFLKSEYDRCQDETLDDERSTAIERYNGEPYGDEEDGRSQVVARDTAETVDYMVISILRTLVSGDRIVEFVHQNSQAAHQATETIMHLLMDEQDGYLLLHDWLKAGLLEKNAVAMTYGEKQPKKRQEMQGISTLALMAAEQQGLKVIEAEETGEEGEEGPIFNAVGMIEQPPKFCDAAVPNEEFYCSPDARTITDAPLKGRMVRKTLSDLIAMGHEQAEVETISSDSRITEQLSQARDQDRITEQGTRMGLARSVWWHEEYATFDANGDGIAELLCIQRSHDFKVFAIQEMDGPDDHPFEDWCPFPMQHRRIGHSLADKTMDLERINTVLWRQSLNGMYSANEPSTYLHEDSIGENTIEDLLTVRTNRIIRYKGLVAPSERSGSFDPSAGLSMLEYTERKRESRTGITRLNQGLDEKTLNQTMGGQAALQMKGEQVEEYIARNFANGLAKLITKKARLLQSYGQPIMVPIDGEYVQVDPRQWPEDMIARARVGLGASRKDQRILFRRELIGMQSAALEGGLGIVDEQGLYNSAKGFVADAGLGDVGEYFNDPSKPKLGPDGQPIQKQERPDPEMLKVQAQIEQKRAELAMKQSESAAKLGMQQQEAQAKLRILQQQGMQQAELDTQKAAFDAQMQQARANFEADLAERELQLNGLLKMQQIAAQERQHARAAAFSASTKNRAGGRLDK